MADSEVELSPFSGRRYVVVALQDRVAWLRFGGGGDGEAAQCLSVVAMATEAPFRVAPMVSSLQKAPSGRDYVAWADGGPLEQYDTTTMAYQSVWLLLEVDDMESTWWELNKDVFWSQDCAEERIERLAARAAKP